MKRTITPIILIILFLSMLVVSGAQAGEKCTEATLKGRYGFHTNGFQAEGEVRLAAVGVVTFDGKGHLDAKLVISRDGVIRRPPPILGASYSVKPDCTGIIDGLEVGGNLQDMVIVDDGNEIRSLVREPSSAIWTGLYKKQKVEDCTPAIMEGNWGYSFQGSILKGESFVPVAIIGRATFDGAEGISVTELRNVGGEYRKLSIDAAYTVDSDYCTIETGTTSYGVLVGDGSEAFTMRTIDGWVVSGFPKKQ